MSIGVEDAGRIDTREYLRATSDEIPVATGTLEIPMTPVLGTRK
jgi:hypothetical protein